MGTRGLILLLLCGAAACAWKRDQRNSDVTPRGSAIVVKGSDLSGNLLESLQVRVPNMRVSRPRPSTTGSQCPQITLRAARSTIAQPSIYVDGTLMLDTCVLDQLPTTDIDRIEIYTSGVVSIPGIRSNPFGVMLIYRRTE